MNCSKMVVIFGGADAESAEARRVALAAGCRVAVATVDGKPVSGGTAYKADGFQLEGGSGSEITEAVIFECNPACAGNLNVVARCDHHNPGDFGYGLGPEQFFEASSIGQLMIFLGLRVIGYERLIAASDHCPAQPTRVCVLALRQSHFVHTALRKKWHSMPLTRNLLTRQIGNSWKRLLRPRSPSFGRLNWLMESATFGQRGLSRSCRKRRSRLSRPIWLRFPIRIGKVIKPEISRSSLGDTPLPRKFRHL